MLAIAANGLGITKVAEHFPKSHIWQTLAFHFDHVTWVGCGFWDLIQPSFMFMVGVSMAYSYVKRQSLGHSYARMLGHATVRAFVLVALGVFLSSNWSKETNYTFVNVLSQIGLGYVFLFLLWGRGAGVQLLTPALILMAYWGAFALYPLPAADFDYASVGVADGPYLSGFAAHWNKNTNVAAAFDVWFLNLFPRSTPFVFNSGGYQTLNFIPSLATMIFGLMAGELLRSKRGEFMKFLWLALAGLAGLAIGMAWHASGCGPIVKRIWTPSWAIYSTGWTLLLLAGFYLSIDLSSKWRWASPLRWCAFPLIVVGVNSITMYCMSQLLKPWTRRSLEIHLGSGFAQILDSTYAPIVEATAVALVLWLFCFWLYRQKVFLKI
jgi:heparan-alpha-glucosaminide N-acetyltransferase